MLSLHGLTHLVCDVFELLEQYVVGTIHYDLGEAGKSTALNVAALRLLDHPEGELLKMSLEELQLLLAVLDTAEDVPLQLAQGLTDDGMQLDCCLVSDLLLETGEDLGDEGDECIFEDLRGHPKLLELLLHLPEVHVIVDLGELTQEHVHALVVGDVGRHELLQLFGGLLLSVHLREFLQRFQQILLELRDIGADERLGPWDGCGLRA